VADEKERIIELERQLARSEKVAATLADAARLYRSLFDGIATAVTIRSLDDQSFIDCNASALRLYGADSVAQLRGLGVLDLSAEAQPDGTPSLAALRKHVNLAIQNGFERCEWLARRLDGTPFTADVRIAVVELESGRRVMQTIIDDISHRKEAEDMQRAAQVELSRAKEDAIAASRAKSAFVANMSHELRTPLNGVIGMVDLLSRTPLDGRQRRYVEVARASASLLLSVINDVLDFSKVEAGKLEIDRIEFSFADAAEEVATMLALSAEDKGLELTCRTDPTLAVPLVGDPARVRQVLVNLIANAIKFTARGEVAVSAIAEEVREGETCVRIEVRDTGVGIAPDAQSGLFLPFSQVDASTTRRHGGTGLGLAICRVLVQLMGGEIGVRSTPGVGSTFWCTLRLARAEGRAAENQAQGAPTIRVQATPKRLTGVRVLAVDDNATNREILRGQLMAAGMTCDVASSGPEALAKLLAGVEKGRPYELCVLDQHMPEMDGSELARHIKDDPRIAATRIVMLGSIGRPIDHQELGRLGIVEWVTKPVWRAQLLRAISGALDGRRASSLAEDPAREQSPPSAAGARLLLVEDVAINAEVAGEILRMAGYAVDVAVDGLQAVELVRGGGYDLVLMDCQLPGIDGFEATRRIRALEVSGSTARQALPILALTASASTEDVERARQAGMDDHIAKPIDVRRLLGTVAKHVVPKAASRSTDDGGGTTAPGVVNLTRALDRLQGNRDLLARIVSQFREEAGAARVRLREGLDRRDASAVRYAAHRLRGQALSLDAGQLVAALGGLEAAVAREDWGATGDALREVEDEVGLLLRAL